MEDGVSKLLWKPVQACNELYRFFAGLLMMGLIRLPSIGQYWSVDLGQEFFRKGLKISRNRFFALMRCFTMSDPEGDKNNIRGEEGYDPIMKIRLS